MDFFKQLIARSKLHRESRVQKLVVAIRILIKPKYEPDAPFYQHLSGKGLIGNWHVFTGA